MVRRYESELRNKDKDLEDCYQDLRKEEQKRLQLEDEVKRLLLKNMTTMNMEALALFKQINSSTTGGKGSTNINSNTSISDATNATDGFSITNTTFTESTNIHTSIEATQSEIIPTSDGISSTNAPGTGPESVSTRPQYRVCVRQDSSVDPLKELYKQSMTSGGKLARVPLVETRTKTKQSR
jgi:hypothetical protein